MRRGRQRVVDKLSQQDNRESRNHWEAPGALEEGGLSCIWVEGERAVKAKYLSSF